MSDDVERAVETAAETGAPLDGDDPTFEAPWQARAFATVVTLHEQGHFEWNEFQARLIETVQAADEDADPSLEVRSEADYYEHWLAAAESLLREKGLLNPAELEARTAAFERGERDASEFVVGVDHAHAHSHDHGHDH